MRSQITLACIFLLFDYQPFSFRRQANYGFKPALEKFVQAQQQQGMDSHKLLTVIWELLQVESTQKADQSGPFDFFDMMYK